MGTQSKTLITFDGVELEWGSLSEGQLLQVSGSYVGGATGSLPVFGTATLDFGATATDTGQVTVTGQSWVTISSQVHAWFMASDVTANNGVYDHWMAATIIPLTVASQVPGDGFTIFAIVTMGKATGQFTVHWEGV